MRRASVALLGFGRVGRAFTRLLLDTRSRLGERYGLQLKLRAILTSRGGLIAEDILNEARLGEAGRVEVTDLSGWRPGLGLDDVLDKVEPGVVVECLSADLGTGEPALGFAANPIETTPATVTVRGPASFVRTMAAATGPRRWPRSGR